MQWLGRAATTWRCLFVQRAVHAAVQGSPRQPNPTHPAQAEHSMELHLPFIMHVMRGRRFTLVPIMVGATSFDRCAGLRPTPVGPGHSYAGLVCLCACCALTPRAKACPSSRCVVHVRSLCAHTGAHTHTHHTTACAAPRPLPPPPAARPPTAACWRPTWTTPLTCSSSPPTFATGACASTTRTTSRRR